MDLNNIRLSAELISDLYKDHLVEVFVDDAPQVSGTPMEKQEKLPDISKNIAVIVNYPGESLPKKAEVLLKNLFNASGVSMEEIAIVNKTNSPTIDEVLKNSKAVFLFGVEPKEMNLPISFPHFQVQPFNGSMYLFSPSLEELENDKLLKSKLWVCLKRIFNIA